MAGSTTSSKLALLCAYSYKTTEDQILETLRVFLRYIQLIKAVTKKQERSGSPLSKDEMESMQGNL